MKFKCSCGSEEYKERDKEIICSNCEDVLFIIQNKKDTFQKHLDGDDDALKSFEKDVKDGIKKDFDERFKK